MKLPPPKCNLAGACADAKSFVRGGPSLTTFLVDEGRKYPNTTICGPSLAHQRNAIEMPYRLRADGGPKLNASMVASGDQNQHC